MQFYPAIPRKHCGIVVVTLLLGTLGVCHPLLATTWDGSTDTDWSKASNWSAGVPTSGVDVIIPSGLGTYPVLTANA